MRIRQQLNSAQLGEHVELLERFRERASGPWRSFWEAQILLAFGKDTEALKILDALREEESVDLRASVQLALGEANEDMKRWEDAVRAYREAEKLPGHSITGAARRVMIQARRGAAEPVERLLTRDLGGLSEDELMMVDLVAAQYVGCFGSGDRHGRVVEVIEGLLSQRPDREQLLHLRATLDENEP